MAIATREKLTPEAARTFDGFSPANVLLVEAALEERREDGYHAYCECTPYADVFTFNRWIAQGFAVQKGQKGIAVSAFYNRTDKLSGESKRQFGRAYVFCRCQVAPVTPRAR